MTRRLLTALFVLFAVHAFSQEANYFSKQGYKNVLKFGTFKLLSSSLEMNYERLMPQSRTGIMLGLSFNAAQNADETRIGFGSELQYRFYFNPWEYRPSNPDKTTDFFGMYVAPYGQYALTNLETHREWWDWQTQLWRTENTEGVFNTYGVGLVMGTQFAVQGKFAFDMFAGGSIRYAQTVSGSAPSLDRSAMSPVYTGVTPRVGLKIGFAY